jgi:hypothetical protein
MLMTWVEIRHPITNALICRYCPQRHVIEAVDRKQRAEIELPKPEPKPDRRGI